MNNSVSIGNVHNGGRTAHPFIAVNAAKTNADPIAVINYSGNISNTDAEIVGNQEWPYANETADGGNVTPEEEKAATTGIYDLQGRRMNSQKQLQKGLYIINGRKVVVK